MCDFIKLASPWYFMMAGSDRVAYFLMRDVEAVKLSSGLKKYVEKFSTVTVLRGELLIQIPENERQQCGDGPLLNFRLFKDPNILLYSGEENVSPLGEDDFKLLEAIASTYDRYAVFSSLNKLSWGANLRRGSRVYVKMHIPPNNHISAEAIVRYRGDVEGLPGRNFGVEITVSESILPIYMYVDTSPCMYLRSRIHILVV